MGCAVLPVPTSGCWPCCSPHCSCGICLTTSRSVFSASARPICITWPKTRYESCSRVPSGSKVAVGWDTWFSSPSFMRRLSGWLGTWRWLCVVVIAHVGATYISEGVLYEGIRHGYVAESAVNTLDVGVSYGLAGVMGILVYSNRRSVAIRLSRGVAALLRCTSDFRHQFHRHRPHVCVVAGIGVLSDHACSVRHVGSDGPVAFAKNRRSSMNRTAESYPLVV